VTKDKLRDESRRRIDRIPPREIYDRSAAVRDRLCQQPEYRRAEIVMIYLSMSKEVDTTRIALQCWSDLKRVLAPKTSWEQRRLLPIEINSLTSDVAPGVIGIREPTGGLPIPVGDIDLVLVPGLAFDQAGNRLGRGRGLYERFLAHHDFHGIVCGLALEEQMMVEIPREEADVRVDLLVTDACVRRFKR
jgi:5-formyltetrahydrofolate cyclo-ligase